MRRFSRRLLLGAGVIACTAAPPLSAEDSCADAEALALLDRMAESGAAVSHRGMATLQRGSDLRVLRVQRQLDGDEVTETVSLLGHDAQAASPPTVRSGHRADCTHPGHDLLRASRRPGDNCGVAAHYRLSVSEGDRVAGRETRRLTAEPRDMYRYAYVLEVDAATAQLLKVTTLTRDGRPLEQFQYASLVLDESSQSTHPPVAQAASEKTENRSADAVPEQAADSGMMSGWRAGWLPAGFVATESSRGARQTFTDGMASFSVFVEPAAGGLPPGEGAVREGSTLAYTRGMQLNGRDVLITVVGEVPVNTARIVADSIGRE
jgi:sigma-E factor negative regulatory protein RseB